jgi:DNA-binding MarR family transcriptional regulator
VELDRVAVGIRDVKGVRGIALRSEVSDHLALDRDTARVEEGLDLRPPTELYREMMLTSGAMTNRIDRLEEAGLVTRRPDPDDRRGTLVRLTPKGKALIDAATTKHVVNEERLLSALTVREQQQLTELLRKLLIGLGDQPGLCVGSHG